MIVKIIINESQLAKLHEVLGAEENFWLNKWSTEKAPERKSFVFIKSCKGQGDQERPVPVYEVVLEVAENYRNRSGKFSFTKTPLARLTAVLHALDLFPEEDGVGC